MSREIQLQVLRGTQANIQESMPLAFGEMYFATDTGNLFFGTPNVGIGYIQIGDTAQVNDRLDQLIVIMESTRRALVSIACESGKAREMDFDLGKISQELAVRPPIGR